MVCYYLRAKVTACTKRPSLNRQRVKNADKPPVQPSKEVRQYEQYTQDLPQKDSPAICGAIFY